MLPLCGNKENEMKSHINLDEISVWKHFREVKKTEPDAGAAELCHLLKQYLETLKDKIRKFQFFDASAGVVGLDLMLVRNVLAEIDNCPADSFMEKLIVALNQQNVVELFERDSIVTRILSQFFSFFPERDYIRRLPFSLCECMFPKNFNSKRLDKPKQLAETIVDDKKSPDEQKVMPDRWHLLRSRIENSDPDELLAKLDESCNYDSDDEENAHTLDLPDNNVGRKLITSSVDERNKMADKIIDIVIKCIDELLKAKPDVEETYKWYDSSYDYRHLGNAIDALLLASGSVSFSPKIYEKLLHAVRGIMEKKPLNAYFIELVARIMHRCFESSSEIFQNKQIMFEFGVSIMNRLSTPFPLCSASYEQELERFYLSILKFTVFAFDATRLEQAEMLFNKDLNEFSSSEKNTEAATGLAQIAVCITSSEDEKKDHQQRGRIVDTFLQALSAINSRHFDFEGPFKILAPCLTEQEERLFAQGFRNMSDIYYSPAKLLEGMLENSLETRRKQYLILEQVFADSANASRKLPVSAR